MGAPIPFDVPSLVLGHVVDDNALKTFATIASLQARTDAAQDKLNSLLSLRRSLNMTIDELSALEMDPSEIKARLVEIDQSISQAARDYMTTRVTNESAIQEARSQAAGAVPDGIIETPLDLQASKVISLPLASDSMKVDIQYFSHGDDSSSSSATSKIENSVREMQAPIGGKAAQEMARSAASQVGQQKKNHQLVGTLVVSISCTHKQCAILDPILLDADQGLALWNSRFAAASHHLDGSDPSAMQRSAEAADANGQGPSLTILSGVSYGSGFVGMVHLVEEETDSAKLTAGQLVEMQERMELATWVKETAGGFGIDSSVVDEARRALSRRSVSCHVNMIVMGALPTFASQSGADAAKDAMRREAGSRQERPQGLGAAEPDKTTMATEVRKAKLRNEVTSMQNSTIGSLTESLARMDSTINRTIDIQTLMTSVTNYLTALNENRDAGGVPTGFFLRRITATQIARGWIQKYYLPGDNGAGTAPGTPSGRR